MPNIPLSINGVEVKFKPNVTPVVSQNLIDALRFVVRPSAYGKIRGTSRYGVVDDPNALEEAGRFQLRSITISSARDSLHSKTSRHYTGQAVDISRMNDLLFGDHYARNAGLRAIVTRMQKRFEAYTPIRRENFGPYQCLKLGASRPDQAEAHKNHIHFSVN